MQDKIELKFGDLFAGAGGLSLGFLLANHPNLIYRPLFAIDNDCNALQGYHDSLKWLSTSAPEVVPSVPSTYVRDIQRLNAKAILRLFKLKKGDLDLLIGGPPCQGYSSANRQSTQSSKSDKNRLSKIFFDILEELLPKMFLIENVQGIRWTQPTPEMRLQTSQLALFSTDTYNIGSVQSFIIERALSLGYTIWHDVLNAVEFGVPQTRYRFFLFGIRSDIASNPKDVQLSKYLEGLKAPEKVTVGEAIDDLPALQNGEIWQGTSYQPGTNSFIQSMRRFMVNGDLSDHFTTKHAEYVIDRYKKIPEGANWEAIRDLMNNYSKIDNTHSNIYRRLRRDSPAITVSHYRKSMIIHPIQHRGLSFREACRLQSFPDWYRFYGSQDQRQQQIANAVPPILASKIAHAIASCWVKCSEDIKKENNDEFSI